MAQQPPSLRIKGPVVEYTSANSVIIAWGTDVPSSTVVKYGTDKNNLDQTAQMPWGSLTHRVTIKNLDPGTTYYFQVESGEAEGTGAAATSGIESFTTKHGIPKTNPAPSKLDQTSQK